MKKKLIGPLLAIIGLALLGAMLVYFYISVNRLEDKLTAVQTAVADNSSKITAIVNFFNSNVNAQTNKQ
jgi:CHASE3 domain sensor protein